MVKEKVSLGNERVLQEMTVWNAFSLWTTHKIVFGFQISHICFESQVYMFLWTVVQFSVIM